MNLNIENVKYFCSNLIYKCTYFIHKVIIIYIIPVVSTLQILIVSYENTLVSFRFTNNKLK